MSMLAERKSKQKWSLNPRGKEWSQDANKFGQKMLEKMGWQTGKGLGAHEDGITEHVKISYKNDSKGMGYKESNDQWTEHETHFSALLESLKGNDSDAVDKQVISLEEKSQSSRARVHYHKFTRGKDLSQYSEKDLANIFGRRSLQKPKRKEVKKESDSSTKENENGNAFLVNAGSMLDYFKKKIPNFGTSNGYVIGNNGVLQKQDSESETESKPTFGFGFNSQKLSKESESEGEMRPSFGFGYKPTESNSKQSKMKKNQSSESESDSKKLKNKTFVSYVSESPSKRAAQEQEEMAFSPKKKSKREKKKIEDNSAGISNPAFNPMATPIKVQKHSLNTIEESLTEEVEESISEPITKSKNKRSSSEYLQSSLENLNIHSEESPKKKKKHNNKFINPSFNENMDETNETTEEVTMDEISTSKTKKKKKKKDAEKMEESTSSNSKKNNKSIEMINPNFIEGDISINSFKVEENPYEVKVKKKSKKLKKMEVDNPNFDDTEDNSIDTSQAVENPYEVKPNEKKKKKKAKKIALDNPTFEDQFERPVESINPYEVKPKKKKKKNIEESGITNPALDLNNSKNEESTILEDCDLMLNIVSTPVQKEERSISSVGSVSKVESVKSKKSVRFSNVTQELIIPNNEDIKEIYGKKEKSKKKNKGFDNVNFDKEKNNLDENVDTMAKTFDSFQAEVENDMNEEKINTLTSDDFMVGEVGNPEGEHEKLEEGTKLKFKFANLDTKTPFYMLDKIGSKKSYKHLIKGDILLKFKNTNLHEIKGYGPKRTNTT